MNMLFLFFVKLTELFFIFFTLKLSNLIPFSYIFGSHFSYLTFFSGAFPSLGAVFPLSTLLYFIFNKSLYNKIGSISSSIILYLFTKNIKYNSQFIFINLLIPILMLIFFTNIPFLYSLGWIFAILCIFFHKNNLFVQSLISSWIGHAYGTLYSYFFKYQLSKEMYISIIPIVWVERIILALLIYTFYKLFNYIFNNFINKYNFKIIKNIFNNFKKRLNY